MEPSEFEEAVEKALNKVPKKIQGDFEEREHPGARKGRSAGCASRSI